MGKSQGAGFNINLPWNKVGMGNSDYLSAFFHVLLPAVYEFCPELVLVSAGFDSGIGDPEGHMMATPDVFAHLTHLLMALAGGKLCVVLEGGLCWGTPVPRPAGLTAPCLSALESVQCVRAAHRQYWGCFRHAEDEVAEPSTKRCELSGDGQVSGGGDSNVGGVPPRLAPPVRTAAAVPVDTGDWLPQTCLRVTGSPQHREEAERALSNVDPTASIEEGALQSLGSVFALLDEILAKKVRNGLALVPNALAAVSRVVRKVLASVTDRVMWVFLGDDEVPVDIPEDNRVLVLQICSREVVARTGFHVPVCVRKSSSSTFLHAVLTLLLPLAYEFNPSLVLLTVSDDGALGDAKYANLIHLLQGLAHGQTLALLPLPCTQNMLKTTACSLLGGSMPSLEPLGPPDPKDLQEIESQRHQLQSQWGLLRTRATNQSPEDQRELHI
ncbi:hypothetical protein GJAV_G00273430 [Gymnothorax javanicus]|nr:hypothetical protein GJAV_G00273430 [Gymnothorax javanicus]